MIINYNDSYALSVELAQVPYKSLYQLKLTKLDKVASIEYGTDVYFFEPRELKQLTTYLNEAANGII